ncbi:ExbD/TolR family protein [Jhaorihella thermophila]|uniref:Biopolymer transport protein ExbD n=1 Tax=Jhaorihella thermophila TaxID=488547 RepID=A0A1H5UNH9_9RHOB|nr:biopolymer transporter ExbD [Jhaorihella thermophila]SEF76609.1 biopolymer transport protein ExbD [Jhaorihella thermophila]
MQFCTPRLRTRSENIVPMINVVFLLLIFFLMTAQIAPPDPFEITPPAADGGDAARTGTPVLLIGADGALAFGDARGDAVFDALSALDRAAPLLIRADEALPARDLAALLPRLAGMGFADLSLATVPAPAGAD